MPRANSSLLVPLWNLSKLSLLAKINKHPLATKAGVFVLKWADDELDYLPI